MFSLPYFSREPAYTYTVRATVTRTKKRYPIKGFRYFWCGRQELNTYDDTKKALIFKAFLLLNANVDAKIFKKIKIPALIETQK